MSLFDGCQMYFAIDGAAYDVMGIAAITKNGSPTLTTDRFGLANRAYSFDANTEYFDTGRKMNYTSGTVFYWIKFDTLTTGMMVFRESGTFNGYQQLTDGGDWKAYFSTNSDAGIIIDAPSTGTWYCCAVTAGGGNARTYVNGAFHNQTANANAMFGNAANVTISDTTYYLIATIGEVMVWNRTLADGEIQALYELTSKKYIYPYPRGERGTVM